MASMRRAAGAARSRPTAAFGVEVLADDVEVGDLAREHAIERALPAEQRIRVRRFHPAVGFALVRDEDLQVLEYPKDIADAFLCVGRQQRVVVLTPLEVRRP